jgi:hypothetical protein
LQNVIDSSVQEYAASMEKTTRFDFDALLPGHGSISMRNGKRHVERAHRDFSTIGLPRNLPL